MKIFLSWSGHKSHEVAIVLRDWLPSVIQSLTPYVSSEDIDKGARWSTDIAKELEDSTLGILCVTKENIEAPWLHFEAGALSKMMDKSFVCPFIFDLKRSEVKGPILQFQSTIFEKEDVKKLVQTINKACGDSALKDDFLLRSFDVWWPALFESLEKIKGITSDVEEKTEPVKNINNEMLEEILELSRTNQKLLRSPDVLFPRDYFEFLFRNRADRMNQRDLDLLQEQKQLFIELQHKSIQCRELLEVYVKEKKVIDEEFYSTMRYLFELMQHQQILFEHTIARRP